MVERPWIFFFLILAGPIISCRGTPRQTAAPDAPSPPAPESRRSKPRQVEISLAIYTDKEGDAAAALAEPQGLAARTMKACTEPSCASVGDLLSREGALSASMALTRDLPPPSMAFTAGHAGAADLERLAKTPRVVMVSVRGAPGPPWVTLAAAHMVTRLLAGELDGLVFDPDTLKLWRADGLPQVTPDGPLPVDDHLSFGVLPVDGAYRIVTFGGRKLGVVDLVAESVPKERVALMMATLAAAVRAMAKSGSQPTSLEITAEDVRASTPSGVELSVLSKGATKLDLGNVARRESDPDNELAALTVPSASTPAEGYDMIAKDLLGESLHPQDGGPKIAPDDARRAD